MWAILPYLLPLGLVVIANLGVARRGWRLLTYICLALLNMITLLAGLLFLCVPYLLRLSKVPLPPALQGLNMSVLGLAFIITASLGFLSLSVPLRRLLARWLPIDPASPVHTTALIFIIYMAVTSLGLLLSDRGLLSTTIEVVNIEPWTVVMGQVAFILFALAGVGLGIRRSLRQTLARLDLRVPTLRQLIAAAVMVGVFLFLDYTISFIWHQLWPTNYDAVMKAAQRLFAQFSSPLGALILALSAGIGEETLFRGALQPRFRIPLTAAVFAVGHVQYMLSPAIVEIFVIGLALGWLRERSNTTTCMAVHIGYNFLDMLIMPYLP